MRQLADKFTKQPSPDALSNEELGRLYEEIAPIRFYLKTLESEVYKRLMNRQEVQGAKLVFGRSDRKWKVGVDKDMLVEKFGQEGLTSPALRSPAQIETLPGGKEFVAEWAYKPEAGLNVVRADDPRAGYVPKLGSELLQKAVDIPI